MARGFHAVLKTLSDHEVELLFDDAPWNGSKTLKNVSVELYERDRSLGVAREKSRDDALGTVRVDLKQGPPNKHGSPTIEITAAEFMGPANPAGVHSGTFDLIVGRERFRVIVYMEPEEWNDSRPPPWASDRRNFIELGLDISTSGKLDYSSRRTDVRPDRLRALRGPVLTIIVQPPAKKQEDKDDFADNAEIYWTPRSDRLVRARQQPISLQEAIDIVEEDVGFDITWYQVNVVTHGNLAGLLMPLRKGERYKEINHFDLTDELMKTAPVRRLRPGSSHVVIRGCTIGRDKRLLKALSHRFGGATVYAPSVHMIAYHPGAGKSGMKELLYRRYWAFRPGNDVKVRPAEIASLLESQRETMPQQPERTFKVIASQAFDRHGKTVQQFFYRSPTVQIRDWDFPDAGVAYVHASQIAADRGILTGKSAFARILAQKSRVGQMLRAELTQPDHVPLDDDDKIWQNLDEWSKQRHWRIVDKNIRNKVRDASAADPLHEVQGKVTLSRTLVEACELEGEITDQKIEGNPHFGSS